MADFFIELLNISITASYLILAVILLRFIFRKIPKKFICFLWGIAAIRLVFPFSIESAISLIPSAETIPEDIAMQSVPAISSGIEIVNSSLNPVIADAFTPNSGDSVNPMQVVTAVASVIWLIGLVIMILYGVISYLRVKKSVKTAVLLENNVWQSESVVSPFILGIFKPKIYIPFNIDDGTRNYVISHENAHLKRRDHFIKPFGFLILSVYWFNPLVWVSYIFLCRDIEAACDEKVVAYMDGETRKEYAHALLDCAVNRRRIAACPLAFGEVSVKNRIKNVMNYKKPAFWVIILAIVTCIVAVLCFLTNPEANEFYDPGRRLNIIVSLNGEIQEAETLVVQEGNEITLNNGIKLKISFVDLQSDEIEVRHSGTPLNNNFVSDIEKGSFVLNLDSSLTFMTDNGETVVFEYVKSQPLEDAITAAIMENSSSDDDIYYYDCSSYELLATKVTRNAKKDIANKVVAYVNTAYGKYVVENGETVLVNGLSSLAEITFSIESDGYTLVHYTEVKDGSNYFEKIKEKLPYSVRNSIIEKRSELEEECLEKADAYFRNNATSEAKYVAETKAYSTYDELEVNAGKIHFGQQDPIVWLQMTNNSSETVTTGRPFWVYRYENGEWVSCAGVEGLAWTLEGILILPGQTRELPCSLRMFDISENGYYRLTKDFYADGETHTANVEFFVDVNEKWDKIEMPPGENVVVPESLYTVYENRVSSKHSESWFEFEKMANNGFIEYDETVEPVDGVIIKSKAEFDKFIKEMSKHFEFSDSDRDIDFMDTAEKFNNKFFENNSIMIMHVRENTYSVTHSVGDITRIHQRPPEESRQESDGYALSFQVHREIPYEDAEAESERFITLIMDNAAIGDVHSVYVTYGEDLQKPVAVYNYISNGGVLIGATVTLYSDTEIMFNYSLLSSYIPHGTYTVKHGKLVMKTDDGRYTYTFKFDNDKLVFDAANSSELPDYNYGDGTKFKPVPDGAVFKKQ